MNEIILQQIFNALTIGSIYALIALGYTMVYGVLRMINFSHSELFMLGGYVSLLVLTMMAGSSGASGPGVLAIVLLVTFGLVGLVGVATERVAYRPLRHGNRLAPMLSALGVSIIFQSSMQLLMGPQPITFPTVVHSTHYEILGATVTSLQIFVFILSIVLLVGLEFLVEKTRLGISVRAVAENHVTASLLGINVDRTVSLIFFVGPGLGALAGFLYGAYYGLVTPTMGVIVGLKAFTAAILGGIGSIRGAVLGGFLLALLEVGGTALLPVVSHGVIGTEYRDIFAFSILILVLLFKPTGLLGESIADAPSITKREF